METYRSNVIGCFIWDLHVTLQRRSNGTSWWLTTKTSWWRTTETSLGISFETCLRRRGDVLREHRFYVLLRRRHDVPIRRREDVPLRRLGEVPLRRHWVFHFRRTCDVAGTYRETSLQCRHDVLLPGGNKALFSLWFLQITNFNWIKMWRRSQLLENYEFWISQIFEKKKNLTISKLNS